MVRYRKRAALYEVIGKSSLKPGSSGKTEQDTQESEKDAGAEPVDDIAIWPRKPRIVQFNGGRVELSVQYQLAIAVLLGVVLVVLVAFWLGQNKGTGRAAETGGRARSVIRKSAAESGRLTRIKSKTKAKPAASGTSEAESAADNRIVIQTLKSRRALEPVKEYFDGAGIETEIRKIGDTYYLVSKQRYGNPDRKGTEGYAAKQKIKQIGAQYEAPSGYASFGTKPFQDAYGMKFND